MITITYKCDKCHHSFNLDNSTDVLMIHKFYSQENLKKDVFFYDYDEDGAKVYTVRCGKCGHKCDNIII